MQSSEVFSRALVITFKHRAFWVMGFLVSVGGNVISFFGGGGSGSRRPGESINRPGSTADAPITQLWEQLLERPDLQGILISVLCVALVLGIVVFILSVIGRGGLIGGLQLAEENRTITLGEMWEKGTHNFGRMLSAQLMLYAPIALGFLLTFCMGVVSIFLPFPGLLCLVPLFCFFPIYLLIGSVVATLAERGIVLDELGPFDAYRHGWALIRANVGRVISFGVIMYAVKFIFGFATVALLAIAIVPGILALDPDNPNWLLLGGAALLFLCLFPITSLINSILTTWDFAAWNLAYQQLTRRATDSIVSNTYPSA